MTLNVVVIHTDYMLLASIKIQDQALNFYKYGP